MQKTYWFIIVLILFGLSTHSQEKIAALESIQAKIAAGYDQAIAGDTSPLISLSDTLGRINTRNKENYLTYWQAYANYKLAIALFSKDKKLSEEKTNKAIALLDALTAKKSEDYVLLGSLLSFSLNFSPGETAILSQKARAYYQKALEMDKDNLRAYFSIGRSDYYRPKEYGGGEIAEANFLKALSKPIKSDTSVYAPSWGKMETYEMLVAFYNREGRKQDALIYCKKGLQEFPQSLSLIQQLKTLEQ